MVSGRDMGRAAATKIKQKRREDRDATAPFQAYANTVSGGMVYIIEDGPNETPWAQGIRVVKGARVRAGDRVQIQPTRGGDYLCIGVVNDDESFAIGETDVYENNSGTALGSPLTSSTPTDVVTVTKTGLPAGSYRVVVKGSVAASHSASGTIDLQCRANASTGTSFGLSVPTSATPTTRITAGHTFTISLNGVESLVGALQYSSASGTITARAPELWMFVKRLS